MKHQTKLLINTRLPYGDQTLGREAYYAAIVFILNWRGFELDRQSYPMVTITKEEKIKSSGIFTNRKRTQTIKVAQIESDLPIGEPDDNCNELNSEFYRRKYKGLEILLLESKYNKEIERIIKVFEALFNQEVILKLKE